MASSDQLLRVTFVDDSVSAVAEMDYERAPGTVSGILQSLPIEGGAFHGMYSGSEVHA
jgi:hypothetical protein